jgi:hypothetical protein
MLRILILSCCLLAHVVAADHAALCKEISGVCKITPMQTMTNGPTTSAIYMNQADPKKLATDLVAAAKAKGFQPMEIPGQAEQNASMNIDQTLLMKDQVHVTVMITNTNMPVAQQGITLSVSDLTQAGQ